MYYQMQLWVIRFAFPVSPRVLSNYLFIKCLMVRMAHMISILQDLLTCECQPTWKSTLSLLTVLLKSLSILKSLAGVLP